MRRLAVVAATLAALPFGAMADEFEDVVESALEAYREGDVAMARDELNYATQLLAERSAEGLAVFLPEPQAGWTREDAGADGSGAAFAMFGGGTVAEALYTNGSEEFTLTLVADSPMISGIAAMVSGMGGMAGRTLRIQRQQFIDSEGELQGVIDGRVLVQASGGASTEDKQAHIEAMDLRALSEF